MNAKTNRLNHDFQIIHFIAGSCHTPDGVFAILCDLKEDRENAIKMFEANRLREKAKRLRAEAALKDGDEIVRLEAQANLVEMEALAETTRKNLEGALSELKTIEDCMRAIQPHRVFKHLPDAEAHEAAQSEEWKHELIQRATNSLLTTGTIAIDQFATMRLHPAFQTEILPAITELRLLMAQAEGQAQIFERIASHRFDLPKLMAGTQDE